MVMEPRHRFMLDVPAGQAASDAVLTALPRFGAVPLTTTTRGATCLVKGVIPASSIASLQRELPGLTSGEGVLETSFDRYVRCAAAGPGSRPGGAADWTRGTGRNTCCASPGASRPRQHVKHSLTVSGTA
jgi:ribosomal protection tetracycline resistance protein